MNPAFWFMFFGVLMLLLGAVTSDKTNMKTTGGTLMVLGFLGLIVAMIYPGGAQ